MLSGKNTKLRYSSERILNLFVFHSETELRFSGPMQPHRLTAPT